MGRRIEARVIEAILDGGRRGESIHRISESTGADRASVSAVLKKHGVEIRAPGRRNLAPPQPSQSAKSIEPFDWSFGEPAESVGHRWSAVAFPLSTPCQLTRAEVRVLLALVASSSRQTSIAPRLGIDRWVGRNVESLEALWTVADEIASALAGLRARYRLELDR